MYKNIGNGQQFEVTEAMFGGAASHRKGALANVVK